MRNLIDKILNWYFSKNSLPYWCIFLIDCGIVMASGVMTYWLFNSTQALYDNTFRVINTLICFVLLSVPGFRLFHTYSGYMRFAGFVDLMRVVYGNLMSLVLVLLAQFGAHLLPEEWFVDFRISAVFLIYLLATLMMWGFRVFVKVAAEIGVGVGGMAHGGGQQGTEAMHVVQDRTVGLHLAHHRDGLDKHAIGIAAFPVASVAQGGEGHAGGVTQFRQNDAESAHQQLVGGGVMCLAPGVNGCTVNPLADNHPVVWLIAGC